MGKLVITHRVPKKSDKPKPKTKPEPRPDTSEAEFQIAELKRLSSDLNQVAAYFDDLGLEAQMSDLDKAGELMSITKYTMERLLGLEPSPDDL